jgi:hypothetical protein
MARGRIALGFLEDSEWMADAAAYLRGDLV